MILIMLMLHYVFQTLLKTNIELFNLMLRINKTRHVTWHKTCSCKCRSDARVCNDKQRRNNDKYRRECKELNYKGKCDLFGIVYVTVNAINHVILEDI